MEKEKKKGMLSIIFFVITILLVFVANSFLGVIFAVLTLIISSIYLKNKNILVIVSFIGSIMIIIYSIIVFIISLKIVNSTISSAKMNAYKQCEQFVEYEAEKYAHNNDILSEINLLKSQITNTCDYCDGYVVINPNANIYKAYLKCEKYKTDGYNQKEYDNLKK